MKPHCSAKVLAFAFLLVSFSIAPFGISAQNTQTANSAEKVASVEGITEYRLPNGLRVLLFPDQTKQTTTVNVTYLVGSRHESYGETGMAHLLEHLVFKGTPKHPNIPNELTTHGASPNGSTWVDRTNYFETFAASDVNLNWALDLEADRMVNSYIAKKDLDSEFSVVRNEMESGENNAFRVLWQRVMGTAYEWHNYGKSTIGARSDVENVPIDRLQAFYKRFYQPDNAVLLVAGKFDESKTLDLIKKYFGAIQKPDRVLPPNYTIEPTQDGERQVTVRRTGDTQYVIAGYHVPPGAHSDAPAIAILSDVLASQPSGRLYKSLVESKKAAIVFPLNLQTKEPGYTLFVSQLRKENSLDDARATMLDTIENFAKTAPTKEEVERAKTAAVKRFELSLNDPNRVGLELSEWIAQGDWRLFFLMRDRLRTVTVEDVQRVAAKYLKQTNRTLGQFIPTEKADRAEIPNVKDSEISALVKDYKGEAAVAQGEAFEPTQANIEARTKRSQIGNLKVAFLPKENRGDTVFLSFVTHFGDEKSLISRTTAGSFTGDMLMRGTSKHTRQQLEDEFNRLKANVRINGTFERAYASVETTRQNLPAVMRLVAEVLREPSFPVNEFETFKQETLTGYENQKSEPSSIAIYALNQHFNRYPKGDVRNSRTLDEQIAAAKALTLDDVKAFYKDFYGASNAELAIVGDFDPNEIAPLTKELFADWTSPRPFQRIAFQHFDVPAINKTFEAPDKANAFFIARLNVKMRDDNPDYPAMALGNYIIGGGFLNSRLATRIRQKEGLSYGVFSGFNVGALDEVASFSANAIYAPENAEKLEAAFKDELNKVITTGFTSEEIEAAKTGWLQQRQLSRAQDAYVASALTTLMFQNKNYFTSEKLEKDVLALTPAQINAAMKKYLTPENITIVKAGDFAKAKEKMKPAQK
ncbi:MAG: insulinase family protein [Acidobacteria bacterium]|jgi:zinc protease|nr:insulinase family protein [Acidobacteriota bacterium]